MNPRRRAETTGLLHTTAPGQPRRPPPGLACSAWLGTLWLLVQVSAALATTWYVDPLAGHDTHDGLAAVPDGRHGPKATLHATIGGAAAGDTVVALPGTYPETVHFGGTELLLTSLDPADPAIVATTVISGDPAAPGGRLAALFDGGEGPAAGLDGLTLSTGNGRGLECRNGSSPTLRRLLIRGNHGSADAPGGGVGCRDSQPRLINSLVCQNSSPIGPGGIDLVRSAATLTSCTIAHNTGTGAAATVGGGLTCEDSQPTLRQCILWGNADTLWPDAPQIVCCGLSLPVVGYSCIQGGQATGAPGATWGPGNLTADPRFADPASGDFRLQSAGGRWNGTQWANDDVTSPGIDAGDPAADGSAESAPNGGRINLGFDGNTPFASRSAAAPLAFVLIPAAVDVPEGGTATFSVALSHAPQTAVTVRVTLHGADSPLAIASAATFTLGPDHWVAGETVVLNTPEDDADSRDSQALVRIEADGVEPAELVAQEIDDDVTLTVIGAEPAGSTLHERGTVVDLRARAEPGFHFGGWEGDVPRTQSFDNPLALTLDRTRTVRAVFGPNRTTCWTAVTVNRPIWPGAAHAWIEGHWDCRGGWTSDLSIVLPPGVPTQHLAFLRSWPRDLPEQVDGGDFENDRPGFRPARWVRCPDWPVERCLVARTAPLYPGCMRSLRLSADPESPQGLYAPRSACPDDAVVQFALHLPAAVPAATGLTEVWHNGVRVAIGTDATGQPGIAVGPASQAQPASLNQPLRLGAWNLVTVFQCSRSDLNGDGMDDGWVKRYLPPTHRAADADADGDGLSNLAEYRLGTDPARADSDGDGMPDGWEVSRRLDPLLDDAMADADGDGLPNLWEARLGMPEGGSDTPVALLRALHDLAVFWSLRGEGEAKALGLVPCGAATVQDGVLLLPSAGGAELTGLPPPLAETRGRTLSLWFRADTGGTLLDAAQPGKAATPGLLLVAAGIGTLTATVAGTDMDRDPVRWSRTAPAEMQAWHHVAIVCPEVAEPALFVDSVPASTPPAVAATGLIQAAAWSRIWLGECPPDPHAAEVFSGAVAAIAWFDTALPADAVRRLFLAGRALPLDELQHLDSDADGLPDAWEYACLGDLGAGAQSDADGDTLANAAEYRWSCDPTNPDSDGDGLSDGAEVQTHGTDPANPDSDADGLADGEELRLGTDPRQADSDGDGLSDGWEVAHGLLPLAADSDGDGLSDAAADNDGDGIPNLAEMQAGTDPGAADVGTSTVSFAAPSTAVREDDLTITVGLALSALPPGRATVDLVVVRAGGTAAPANDVDFADTPVSFAAGRLTASVAVRLRRDTVREPTETVVLAIRDLRGARLGTYATHTLLIADAVSPADDSDSDGLPDDWEMRHFGNLEESADSDPDHDGLPNLEEYRLGGRPDRPYRLVTPAELGLRITGLSR